MAYALGFLLLPAGIIALIVGALIEQSRLDEFNRRDNKK